MLNQYNEMEVCLCAHVSCQCTKSMASNYIASNYIDVPWSTGLAECESFIFLVNK